MRGTTSTSKHEKGNAMSRHARNSRQKRQQLAAPDGAHATLASNARRNMLYALTAGTAVVITVAIFVSVNKPPQPGSAGISASAETRFTGPRVLTSGAPAYDFGRISMAAGNVSHRYSIMNTGTNPLTITQILTSCMCTEATLITRSARKGPYGMPGHGYSRSVSERLAPGESAQVDVVFDPAAHGPAGVGNIDRTVTILTDAGSPLELRFNAMVTP